MIVLSGFPMMAWVPVYHWFAPVLLPLEWLGAAVGGWTLRVVYGLFSAFVAFQTLAMAQWGFTQCANHPTVWLVAMPMGLAVGALLVLTSQGGPSLGAFGPFGGALIVVFALLALGLLLFNPGLHGFASPGCRG